MSNLVRWVTDWENTKCCTHERTGGVMDNGSELLIKGTVPISIGFVIFTYGGLHKPL